MARTAGRAAGGAGGPLATYRIAVGKRHKVEPRQIVGALANEGGLGRQDFGHIDIRADHSLVELPADLPAGTWERLRATRISGQLIELSESSERGGRPGAQAAPQGPARLTAGEARRVRAGRAQAEAADDAGVEDVLDAESLRADPLVLDDESEDGLAGEVLLDVARESLR